MDIDATATARVLKARTELVMARRFYGVLVSQVEPVLSRQYPTMATDSRRHYYNPDFIATITQEELLGVQAHESEHDARHHGTRRNGRDPKRWNKACDYGINIDLIDEGFKLPKGALIDRRFKGMCAEDIYRTLELDEQAQQQQQEQDDDGEEDEASPQGGDQGDGEDADDADPAGEGEAGDDGSDDGSAGEQAPDAGSASKGAQDDAQASAANGEGDAGDAEPQSQPSSGDPGGCGEVLDSAAPDRDADASDADMKWERIVRQAASMAKNVGQLPGHVQSIIDAANEAGQDWREVFRAWVDQGSRRIETWNRPNRRFAASGLILPSTQRDGVNHVAFIIDTSGSVDDVALQMVAGETQGALDDGAITKATVIYCDTRVTAVQEYNEGDQIEFDAKGRGGTRLRPAFEYVRDNLDDVSLIVCFTDMENDDWGDEPESPVLFAAFGYPDKVKRYLASAPWDAPGIDVGAH